MPDGLLRISEAVAADCAHINAESDGTGRLLIPSPKTDQTGARGCCLPRQDDNGRCRRLHQFAGIESGPLFRRGGYITGLCVCTRGEATIKARVAAGIEGESGHSL